MLENAEWIWVHGQATPDEYAAFQCAFQGEKATLEIVSEGNYAAYVNGSLAACGQYLGYPDKKFADSVALDGFLNAGKNELEIVVWYHGTDTSGYIDDGAGVIFRIVREGKTLVQSDETILCRREMRYKNGYKKIISDQLGYSFYYDSEAVNGEWEPAAVVEKTRNILPRPVEKLVWGEPVKSTLVKREGNVYLFDLGAETAGQLYLDVDSSVRQELLIAYGEHIEDGWVRRRIGNRDFSAEYVAPEGRSVYVHPFRRFGCRYLEVHAVAPITINEMTLIPTDYPLTKLPAVLDSPIRQRIYDVAYDTLRLCRHEHYEDCPWREQALYTFDSRNEMLAEYYATGDYKFARANIQLISHGVREDGLLELTYPARNTPAIPMFSLIYPIQVLEYMRHSGDRSILGEVAPVLRGIMENFRRRSQDGLIADFPYPYWNFYEWGNESDNADELSRNEKDGYKERYSLILNCMYVYAEECYGELFREDSISVGHFKEKIAQAFYDERTGLFRAYIGEEYYTEFGNSLAILIGLGTKEIAEKLLKGEALPVTLSAAAYYFDALLSFGYEDEVLKKLDADYGHMLEHGATSFWETIGGAGEWGGAGSLCHAWSALPLYYYSILNKVKSVKKEK